MANQDINNYITKRYDNWLDSAKFRCRLAGIPDEAVDVLQEVVCALLQKEDAVLAGMLSRKKDNYTELDWFVIRMIELNATSPTSPYRHKTRRGNIDPDVDFQRLEIIDMNEEEEDASGRILSQIQTVRRIYETLEISESSRRIFEYRFFQHEDFADWPGKESPKYLYDTFNRIISIIKAKIHRELYLKRKTEVNKA